MIDYIGGTVDIAPRVECEMGCGPDANQYIQTNGTLEANYLIFFSGSETFLLICLDLLYVGKYLQESLESGLKNFVNKENLLIVASHTHYAPMVDTEKPKFGLTNLAYIESISKKICEQIITQASTERQNAQLEHAQYSTKQIQFRRKKRFLGLKNGRIVINHVVLGPAENPIDIKANLVLLTQKDLITAIIWNFPCHPTSLPVREKFDAHFIGEVRNHIRMRNGREIPFIFLQGFSGDLRPPSHVVNTRNFKEWIRKNFFGSWFRDFEEFEYKNWVSGILSEFDDSYEELRNRHSFNTNKVSSTQISVPLSDFAQLAYELEDRKIVFQTLDFEAFALVGVSAEMVYPYQEFLNNLSPEKILIGVGCLGDVFGYMPTAKMQKEGGYESLEYFPFFNLKSLKLNVEASTKYYLKKVLGF